MSAKAKAPKLINTDNQSKVPFSVVEAYKNLRVHLLAHFEACNGKIVAISSPNASEGNTTTAINTAITLAQLEKKILLIDTDSRRPAVHRKLKMTNEIGCLEVISGKASLEDAVKSYIPYLDVLTAGSTTSAAEFFASAAFDELLIKLRDEYDYIVIDTPPVNLVSDALVVSQKCDGLMLVVRNNVTTYSAFNEAISDIKKLNINFFGAIMNGAGGKGSNSYQYRHGYNQYYGSK